MGNQLTTRSVLEELLTRIGDQPVKQITRTTKVITDVGLHTVTEVMKKNGDKAVFYRSRTLK